MNLFQEVSAKNVYCIEADPYLNPILPNENVGGCENKVRQGLSFAYLEHSLSIPLFGIVSGLRPQFAWSAGTWSRTCSLAIRVLPALHHPAGTVVSLELLSTTFPGVDCRAAPL